MSSNSASPPEGAGKTGSPGRGSWSLTTRLALLAAFSSFVILAAVSVQMYFQLANHLREQNYLYLKDETEALGEMARFPDFLETVAKEMHIEHAGEEYVAHYVRLIERDGAKSTIIETPGMENVLPRNVFPPPGKDARHGDKITASGRNGLSFVVTSVLIDTGKSHEKQMILQVGLDVTNVGKILAGYRTKLAVALGVGFLLCTAAGMVIARRGTRPIREITAKARQITVANLDERLSGEDWPREMNDLAAALNGMLDRLQDSFSRMYGSVANLTHKLRTPITILKGEAEIALGRERTAEELREVIGSSIEECDRLAHLIDNIIFISQAEAGKLQHVLVKIKARVEIDKVLDFYAPLAEEKGLTVTCEGDATVAADPTLFRKAVANLLSNAVTYTNPGGSVGITARQEDDGSVEIRVTDTGCGIADQELAKIFDRFYRVYATRFMDPHGSGLGLPLVKTIMDLHHGTIEVRSRIGEGTTAILKFPLPA